MVFKNPKTIMHLSGYVLLAVILVVLSVREGHLCRETGYVISGIAFLLILQLQGALRYVLLAALCALLCLSVSPYLVVLIPVYLCVRAWEKDSRLGIVSVLLFVTVFSVLYETGVFQFLWNLRPERYSEVQGFRKTFPAEDYAGHVSYYLLDLLYLFGRLLVPYEVFLLKKPVLILYFILQIASLAAMFVWILREVDAGHRENRSHADRIRKDVMTAIFAVYVVMAVVIPDYSAAARVLISLYPLFAFLLFGQKPEPIPEEIHEELPEQEADPEEEPEEDSEDEKREK